MWQRREMPVGSLCPGGLRAQQGPNKDISKQGPNKWRYKQTNWTHTVLITQTLFSWEGSLRHDVFKRFYGPPTDHPFRSYGQNGPMLECQLKLK